MREVAEDWSAWDDFALEVEEAIPVSDDEVLLLVRMSGRMPGSSGQVDASVAQLWTLRDGKGYRMVPFWNRADGFKAAGLSE